MRWLQAVRSISKIAMLTMMLSTAASAQQGLFQSQQLTPAGEYTKGIEGRSTRAAICTSSISAARARSAA